MSRKRIVFFALMCILVGLAIIVNYLYRDFLKYGIAVRYSFVESYLRSAAKQESTYNQAYGYYSENVPINEWNVPTNFHLYLGNKVYSNVPVSDCDNNSYIFYSSFLITLCGNLDGDSTLHIVSIDENENIIYFSRDLGIPEPGDSLPLIDLK